MAEPLTPSEQETLRHLEEQFAETSESAQAFPHLHAEHPGRRRRTPAPAWLLLTAGVLLTGAGWTLDVGSAVVVGVVLLVAGDLAAKQGHSLLRLLWAGIRKWWISSA
jgi:hypothetical protein